MKRIQLPISTFTNRYIRVACKVSHATKLVRDLYAIAPTYECLGEEKSDTKGVLVLTFSIPSGTCDSELILIDNVIDYLLGE